MLLQIEKGVKLDVSGSCFMHVGLIARAYRIGNEEKLGRLASSPSKLALTIHR